MVWLLSQRVGVGAQRGEVVSSMTARMMTYQQRVVPQLPVPLLRSARGLVGCCHQCTIRHGLARARQAAFAALGHQTVSEAE